MKYSDVTKNEVEYRKAWVEFYRAHFGGKEDVK